MKRPVVVDPDAGAEFEDAALWYEARRPGLGLEFVAEIEAVKDIGPGNRPRSAPAWLLDIPDSTVGRGRS
jgi:hypothetical protein